MGLHFTTASTATRKQGTPRRGDGAGRKGALLLVCRLLPEKKVGEKIKRCRNRETTFPPGHRNGNKKEGTKVAPGKRKKPRSEDRKKNIPKAGECANHTAPNSHQSLEPFTAGESIIVLNGGGRRAKKKPHPNVSQWTGRNVFVNEVRGGIRGHCW